MSLKLVSRNPLRIQAQTRDMILHAEDPNNPSPNRVGKITDLGKVYGGLLNWVSSLPEQDRDRALDALVELTGKLTGYEKAAGGPLENNGSPTLTADKARRMIFSGRQQSWDAGSKRVRTHEDNAGPKSTADLIRSINRANTEAWAR